MNRGILAKTIALAGLSFLLFASCSCAQVNRIPVPAHPHASFRNIEDTLNSTVALIRPMGGMSALMSEEPSDFETEWSGPYCTGFYIAPGYLVTAAHCLQNVMSFVLPDGSVFTIIGENPNLIGTPAWFLRYSDVEHDISVESTIETPHAATVVAHDPENDIVILFTQDESVYFVPLAIREPSLSEHVYAIGHPTGLAWSIGDGLISRIFRHNDDRRIYAVQTSILTVGGCSGGPLLSEDGEVLGMADAYVNGHPHLSLYMGTDMLQLAYEVAQFYVEVNNLDPSSEAGVTEAQNHNN